MRRVLVVASLAAAAVVAVAVVAIVRASGSSGKTVQTVGGHDIAREDLELTVEHSHEEADRLPRKGSLAS